jgi:RecB family exonuclease
MAEFRYSSGEEAISYNFGYDNPESGEVILSGRIDRIDRTSDGKSVRIIDYKTGSANTKPEKLQGGTSLQLPLYLKAVLDSNKSVNSSGSNAQYLRILPDGSVKRYVIDGDQLEMLKPALDLTVGTINTLIHKGFFPPDHVKGACDYCSSALACHAISREKAVHVFGDSNLELIRTMREDA